MNGLFLEVSGVRQGDGKGSMAQVPIPLLQKIHAPLNFPPFLYVGEKQSTILTPNGFVFAFLRSVPSSSVSSRESSRETASMLRWRPWFVDALAVWGRAVTELAAATGAVDGGTNEGSI